MSGNGASRPLTVEEIQRKYTHASMSESTAADLATDINEMVKPLAKLWAKFMEMVRDAEWVTFEMDMDPLMETARELGLFAYEEWDEKKHGPDGLDIEGEDGDMIWIITPLGRELEKKSQA